MPLSVSRRDWLCLAGGGAVGLLLSPIPWKTLDDVAIWSQNMPWVPAPPRGPESVRATVCTVCSAGCRLRARCVAGVPVALAAMPGAGAIAGRPCPIGLAAHHLPYHPARVRSCARVDRAGARRTLVPIDRAAAVAAMADAVALARRRGERVVVLDARPGRTISWLYRQVLGALPGGAVLTPPGADGLLAPPGLAGPDPAPVGVDLSRARTLVSFGAPVLDGWSAPGVVERWRSGAGVGLAVIQVETRPSRTALAADRWLPIRPGSEAAVALGLAHLVLQAAPENAARAAALAGLRAIVEPFTPQVVLRAAAVPVSHLLATAEDLVRRCPTVAIPGVDPGGGPLPRCDAAAVWALNAALDAVGAGGALTRRRDVAAPGVGTPLAPLVRLEEVDPASVRLLVLDAAPAETIVPWPLLERLLVADGSLVVSLSPYSTGLARHAGLVVPAPAPFEDVGEALAPLGSPRSSWSIAEPLLPAPDGATPPALVLAELAAAAGLTAPLGAGDLTAALRARCEAVLAERRGSVAGHDGASERPVSSFGDSRALWDALARGATWVDDDQPLETVTPRLSAADTGSLVSARAAARADRDVTVMPYGWKVAAAREALPPVLSKLYRESGLRPASPQASLGPATAAACGVAHGKRARLETAAGAVDVRVVVDPAVMPGVVHLASGPDPACLGEAGDDEAEGADLCVEPGSPTWRLARGTLREA